MLLSKQKRFNMLDLSQHLIGQTDQLINVDLKADLAQLILVMSQQAEKRICIFSHHLDHVLFDQVALYDAIKALAIKNRHTYIQILVQDTKPMTRKGHQLLELSRRLSSHIAIKKVSKDQQNILKTFIIFDNYAYITHDDPDRYDGKANFYAPMAVRQFSEKFELFWQQAHIDSSLRQLNI